jgi:carbonic anhydrase
MRLFEAILDANRRALAGDGTARLQPGDLEGSLPVVALTCIDPRLNPLIPEVLGISEEQFIWLRNAGNIITGPLSSTLRSLALACALKGGKEIAVIGHTDCRVGQTTVLELTERLKALGIERAQLPDNLAAFFGLFGSERQNVLTAVEHIRSSPLISPRVPVHGLLVDTRTGRLEWLVNGYEAPARSTVAGASLGQPLAPFELGAMDFPAARIGEAASQVEQAAGKAAAALEQIGERLPADTRARSVAEKMAEAIGKIGEAAGQVEDWAERQPPKPPAPMPRAEPRRAPTPPSLPIPPPLPKAKSGRETRIPPGFKPHPRGPTE